MITHEQIEEAIGLLSALVDRSPATEPDEYDIGYCLYCGAKVRSIASGIIVHKNECPWNKAHRFVETLPSDWADRSLDRPTTPRMS